MNWYFLSVCAWYYQIIGDFHRFPLLFCLPLFPILIWADTHVMLPHVQIVAATYATTSIPSYFPVKGMDGMPTLLLWFYHNLPLLCQLCLIPDLGLSSSCLKSWNTHLNNLVESVVPSLPLSTHPKSPGLAQANEPRVALSSKQKYRLYIKLRFFLQYTYSGRNRKDEPKA